MGIKAILAEAYDMAAGVGPELIAFVAGSGGTLFGSGIVVGVAKKRFEDLERKVEKQRTRLLSVEEQNDKLLGALRDIVNFMRHGDGAVPRKLLDDISDILAVPVRRDHKGSI